MSEKVCSYCWRSLCGCGAEDYGDGPGEVETLEERGIPFCIMQGAFCIK